MKYPSGHLIPTMKRINATWKAKRKTKMKCL